MAAELVVGSVYYFTDHYLQEFPNYGSSRYGGHEGERLDSAQGPKN
jgi:hypothetical protein